MRAIYTSVLVRSVVRDDAGQIRPAEEFIFERGWLRK